MNMRGFSLVEVLIAAGLMGAMAIGFVKIMDSQQTSMKYYEASMAMTELVSRSKWHMQSRDACIASFDTASVGGQITVFRDRNKKPLLVVGAPNKEGLYIENMTLVNDDIAEPFTNGSEGNIELVVNFKKKYGKTYRSIGQRFKFYVTVDSAGAIIDCYAAESALKEELCQEMGGTLEGGKCTLSSNTMCSNAVGERGIKNTVSASYKGTSQKYYVYYSSGNSPLLRFVKDPGCGTGNVNDSAFYKCMNAAGGQFASCGNAGTDSVFPTPNSSWFSGIKCIRTNKGHDLEWCGKGGIDGSWATYSCGQDEDKYTFNIDCDKQL